MTTPTPPRCDALSPTARYSTWLNLVNRLLGSNCLYNVQAEGNRCLIPVPWKINDTLSVPYGGADVPFLKRLLFSSDGSQVCKSLQALVERAYDRHKAMDMLRLDVLSPLNRLTRHAEPFARQRCCVLIAVLAGQPLGKVSVVRNAALVRNVLALTADPVYAVRFHCAAALAALAEHRPGNEAMAAAGCAERVLSRLRAEQDDRVVPALLRVVGRLTAAAGGGGGAVNSDGATTCGRPADLADLSSPGAGPRNGAEAGALLDCGGGGGDPWTGRGLFEYLKRGARSPDYRTAVDSVACLSRGAAAMRETAEYLARDLDTVDLLVSFASSPRLRGRALRAFSAQLLCAVARTTPGLANLRAAAADARWTPDGDDDGGGGGGSGASFDAAAADYTKRLARALRPRASDGRGPAAAT